jgi:hypothetical protein
MYILEKKLDENRRAIGLLSYWPAQQDQAGQLTAHTGYETAMAGFASMDELFRKSGLLAYSQPAEEEFAGDSAGGLAEEGLVEEPENWSVSEPVGESRLVAPVTLTK